MINKLIKLEQEHLKEAVARGDYREAAITRRILDAISADGFVFPTFVR
jgi:hypothetical protein